MTVEVTHRGYTIRYNENADEWTCYDVDTAKGGSYSSPKLSSVKAAIDKMLLDVRKKNALACFEIGGSDYRATKIEATITEYAKRKVERDYYDSKKADRIVHIVGVVATRGRNERASRRNVEIDHLMPDTPEALEAFARYEAARGRVEAAEKEAKVAFNAIPRVTIDMIPELVRIAEAGEEGEE